LRNKDKNRQEKKLSDVLKNAADRKSMKPEIVLKKQISILTTMKVRSGGIHRKSLKLKPNG
jgi:hypothetical protein